MARMAAMANTKSASSQCLLCSWLCPSQRYINWQLAGALSVRMSCAVVRVESELEKADLRAPNEFDLPLNGDKQRPTQHHCVGSLLLIDLRIDQPTKQHDVEVRQSKARKRKLFGHSPISHVPPPYPQKTAATIRRSRSTLICSHSSRRKSSAVRCAWAKRLTHG